MKTLAILAALISSTALAQNMRRDDLSSSPYLQNQSIFAIPFSPRIPLIRASVTNWSLEAPGYQLRCDDVAETCTTAMLRSSSAGRDGVARFIHAESAQAWQGTEVSFRAELRVGRAAGEAALVIRVEDAAGNELQRVSSAPLTGTTRFGVQTVSLKVPDNAERITFAVELHGTGAVFFRELLIDDLQLLASAP
jgi:hypothetical protein